MNLDHLPTPEERCARIRELAQRIVETANMIGVVLTIEQVPLKPLAMGHYMTCVNVRPRVDRRAQTDSVPAAAPDKRKLGLVNKFAVYRTDGSSAPGGKHYGCDYFVLDITHDRFAAPALLAYAKACEKQYPKLARDLRTMADNVGAGHK